MGNSLAPRRRWRKIAALAGALALLAAACGGDSDSNGGGGDGNTGESADAKQGGEITYAIEAETIDFCLPESRLAVPGIMITMAVYDTLVTMNGDGELVPFLAESVEPNEDGTVWTITLREGIEFHNGEPLNADAVKLNLDAYRGALPEFTNNFLLKTVFNAPTMGLIDGVGEGDDLDPTGTNRGISDVQVVDDLTVEVTTSEPFWTLPQLLYATGRAGIMAPEQIQLRSQGDACQTTMIGTGPFVQEEPGQVQSPRLVRNESYWREDSEGRALPYLDAIQFRAQPDAVSRENGVEGGQFDVTHFDQGVNIEAMNRLADAGQAAVHTEGPGFREISYTLLNNDRAPFDNVNARKAFFLASDNQNIIDVRMAGLADIATGLYDVDAGGYLDREESGLPDDSDREAALEEARGLVQAYEDETGQSFAFEAQTTQNPQNTRILELIQENVAEAGIDMSIAAPIDQATIITEAAAAGLADSGANAPQLFLWRNHPGGGNCAGQAVWFAAGYPTNFSIIKDEELTAIFQEAVSTEDGEARDELCADANRRINDQLYSAWGWFTPWTIVADPQVNGLWGPDLPGDGGPPMDNLAGLHRVDGIWLN